MDGTSIFNVESPQNYEQKCCCVLVLDTSGSMDGEPIQELNEGLVTFQKDVMKDATALDRLEVMIVAFNSSVELVVNPSLVNNFTMPVLQASGTTRLVDGVRAGITNIRDRKQFYRNTGQPYYRPWIILITDGAPDSGQDVLGLAREIKEGMDKKDFHFVAIGVDKADMAMLASITHPTVPPLKLQGVNFSQFFRWLSQSMSAISSSNGGAVNLPRTDSWTEGYSTT